MREHATVEDTFSVLSIPGLYKEDVVQLWLSQLRAAALRSETLVAEVRDSSGTQRKKNVRR
jgi:hypothetical protein